MPESLATEHDYGSPMSPSAASHRGPGTVPVQQTQQASSPHAPAGSAGGEGESSSAPPGYAVFFAQCCLGKIPGGAPFSQLHKSGNGSRVDRP